jgi:1,4-alpha-glucan branching enzyme
MMSIPPGTIDLSDPTSEGRAIVADDLRRFRDGTHFRLHEKLGSRPASVDGKSGVSFAVWAPAAKRVSVLGDFNGWTAGRHALEPLPAAGVWSGFVPEIGRGTYYKYRIESKVSNYGVAKADPFALRAEIPPGTASIVWDLDYDWGDAEWMAARAARNAPSAPMSIYEVHLGSWRRRADDPAQMPGYRELAEELIPYVCEMGFTHVEFLPLTEHPFYGSWGYQTTGYFAPTGRYGTPQELMELIDRLHQSGIGVILDWVPSHFPTDEHGLGFFDGTHLFEHADARQGFHPDWGSLIFNYGRKEVVSFLISSAFLWLDRYHADGLRVDAVASMLYLDYSRKEGEWIPNKYGGRENLEAIAFLRKLNESVYHEFPDVQTIAEESTAWPMVSRPVHLGGLGFGLKWDMGWMHDTLLYMSRDPVHRRHHHNNLTFRLLYAFNENFTLPLSHDEVVHGKGSLLGRMPGDRWQQLANLRLLYGAMYGQPAKKLLFMGGEFAQCGEWNHDDSLEWHLLQDEDHAAVMRWLAALNRFYRREAALHELDCDPAGFEWIDANDADQSVLSFLRKGRTTDDLILVVGNFTPVPRHDYRVGLPRGGPWREVLNSDAREYGGGGLANGSLPDAAAVRTHGRPYSVPLTLPPLGMVFLKSEGRG